MKSIVTVTLNPAIDGSCEAQRVRPTHKIRTSSERYDPGGGGINVARVAKRLGGDVRACYFAGGATGAVLDALLERDGIACTRIDIADHTRISHAVFERETGLEYRFVPEGPLVTDAEWRSGCDVLAAMRCDYLVISGSLPRGLATDSYVKLAAKARENGALVLLDTSGAALERTLAAGGLFLVKPSLGELEHLAGRPLRSPDLLVEAASAIIRSGQARYVAVTMGHEGALLASAEGAIRLPAIQVEARSAVGAGDSFLGAIVSSLARGTEIGEAFRLGVAAGAATVLTPGTGLCDPADIERLLGQVASV